MIDFLGEVMESNYASASASACVTLRYVTLRYAVTSHFSENESFKPQGDLAGNPQQPRIRQASPRLAVGAGGGAGRRLAQRQAKGLDLLERVAAGKRRSHDLEEEPPEGHHRRIGALALRRGKTLQFQQRAEGPKQLFEGALAEAAGRPAQPTGEWDWRHARYYQYTYL